MYVYKSAGNCIIKLKLLSDSLTNLTRDKVVDINHAKFRCNKAEVVDIYDKFNGQKMYSVNSDYDETFKYKVGKIVDDKGYNIIKNRVCTKGIHFYLTEITAYFHCLNTVKYSGKYKSWHDNGQQYVICTYINGEFDEAYESWYRNGQRNETCTFKSGEFDGKYMSWNENGQQDDICAYKNGKINIVLSNYFYIGVIGLFITYLLVKK